MSNFHNRTKTNSLVKLPNNQLFCLFEFSLLLMQLRFIRRCNFLCAWIIQHCSLSALVVRCTVKNQWRERLSAWGQALFSTPAAKRTSYVRVGGLGGGGAQSTTSTAWQLLSLCHHVFSPCFLSLSVLTWAMPRLSPFILHHASA